MKIVEKKKQVKPEMKDRYDKLLEERRKALETIPEPKQAPLPKKRPKGSKDIIEMLRDLEE